MYWIDEHKGELLVFLSLLGIRVKQEHDFLTIGSTPLLRRKDKSIWFVNPDGVWYKGVSAHEMMTP